MPELPEVEVVRRGLEPRTVGRRIESVEVLDPRILRRQSGGADRLRGALAGTRMTAVVRRGKFLWWRLADETGEDTGEALMAHLGMSGQLRVRDAGALTAASGVAAPSEGPASDPLRHRRLTLHLDDGTAIDLIDQRIFGGIWASPLERAADGAAAGLGSPDALLPADAARIARDLLDPAADLPAIARTIRSRRAGVKSLLLGQDLVSGIGNIYADEALWEARTRYDTPGAALTQRRALGILRAAGEVMERALAVGGTSFDALYVNVDGRSGYFALSLNVYGRAGQPCRRCESPIVREKFANRSSHFCPCCQRIR
ncbi:DNA-formamidopyrimidine glycosylase [Brachybacterium sp. P6-10-X1]|uniref:bifunctional DNA-formamidopyrimidine glycosylase/DNA-(apurinic or apyrimidinic site) lyase n=1 Tax=Brachybacterium sp. P6-10-X1 TaxID=1903186 RepID=UPI0009719976|nr:bifunctional DNA-formamidopyrimidine glycosylase/DNA-(apurinic or apyrimidinic site) lyase [Brachybacterium sp. P6-10-X1]APX32207.1 DNA-formamidopyrimidine glycosylase [Brachybacterium sp. P6-10-X1]